MQVFRRAFARADVPIGFTQGFHPHPNLNILLPLPTGFESVCELLDFALDAPRLPDQFLYRINRALPAGICVTSVGEARTPAKFIRYAAYEMNADIPIEAERIAELFSREELVVTKRTKRGESETNILPLLRDLNVQTRDGGVTIRAKVAAGNENLNPEYILAAIEKYCERGLPMRPICAARCMMQNCGCSADCLVNAYRQSGTKSAGGWVWMAD